MELAWYLFFAALFGTLVCGDAASAADAAFQSWLQSLWPQAQEHGVSRATFDMATRGLEPDLSLPELVIPGRPEPRSGTAGIRSDAGGLPERSVD